MTDTKTYRFVHGEFFVTVLGGDDTQSKIVLHKKLPLTFITEFSLAT